MSRLEEPAEEVLEPEPREVERRVALVSADFFELG